MRTPGRWGRHRALGTVAALAVGALLAAGCDADPQGMPALESGLVAPPLPVEADAAGVVLTASDESPAATSRPPREVPWTPDVWDLPPEDASPVGLWVPRIDVAAPMRGLGLNRDGTLEVPSEADVVGWYTGGPRPGVYGPSVIAGHVDSRRGPGVFRHLAHLQRGDLVHVVYDDGHVATFVVVGKERVDKDAFPTARVYGDTPAPELRLITCGGRFDRSSRSYEENVIVYARMYASWQTDPPG